MAHMRILIFAISILFTLTAEAQLDTPNHRAGAPFRAKLSPPHAEGTVLVVSGRVRDAEGRGVASAVLDAFQADAKGDYDTKGYDYRARIMTDEEGRFEFETIVPSNYGPPPHIHFIVSADGFKTKNTEMFFRDAEHPTNNSPELTPKLEERRAGDKRYLVGKFDIELARAG